MTSGTVKWFDDEKGYGFISTEGQPDVFVHYSQIRSDSRRRTLVEGQVVEFDLVQGQKGLAAENVRVLGGPGANGRRGAAPA
ncbi:MAG: cold-shock protein [Myxococcota bacterium]|nr:cold-shock protein [Myxococcota bacterium]MDW8364180.1 cold-shock protein [Myxococcales bacterium]